MHRPYVGRMVVAFFAMIVAAATEPVAPMLLQQLLDRGFVGNPDFSLWWVPIIAIGLMVVRGAAIYLSTYMMAWTTTNILNELRRQMFERLLNVPAGYFGGTSVGQVINSIMFEVQQITGMVTNVFTSIVRSSLTLLGLLAWLFYLNWMLSLVTLILIPILAVVVRAIGGRLKKLNQETLAINAELTQAVEESTRAHLVIKIFGGHTYENSRFKQKADNLRRFSMRTVRTFASTMPVTQILTACAISVVVVIALLQSARGEMTVGGFVSFITAMLMLLTPLRQLAEVNGPLQRGLAAAESVFTLIDAPVERTGGKVLDKRVEGRVEFIDVSFAYPEQQQPALQGINLKVAPGETIAFVGMSGGGKTTMVNLLPDFYTPTQGKILLDGQSIQEISLTSLRQQIAMVSQHVVLFDDTVAANIAYGDPMPDMVRVKAAAQAAYLEDVIAALPEGYDTSIGDNGSRLSGGQRQRLAIARAIYKDAPVLILDEATSALDSESERMVQAALDRLMQGRTTFVIAHRLSTIERASRIVVLAEGRVREIGTHDELLQHKGMYANLYHMQFASEATGASASEKKI
ncbi:MAG: lipid A export permease/ATP-binding protein MsbA [Oxalobacter sp.]|nr:MAG: lipid A export permease/ATP-binding protein MsbA [Oxalobacter sp.]